MVDGSFQQHTKQPKRYYVVAASLCVGPFFLSLALFHSISFGLVRCCCCCCRHGFCCYEQNHARFNLNWRSLTLNNEYTPSLPTQSGPRKHGSFFFRIPIILSLSISRESTQPKNQQSSWNTADFLCYLFLGYTLHLTTLCRFLWTFLLSSFPQKCVSATFFFFLSFVVCYLFLCVIFVSFCAKEKNPTFNDTLYAIPGINWF